MIARIVLYPYLSNKMHVPERITDLLSRSPLGHNAIAYVVFLAFALALSGVAYLWLVPNFIIVS